MKREKPEYGALSARADRISDGNQINGESYKDDAGYMECVSDILGHPVFNSMAQYYQHGNTTCREHCIRVSYMSYRICRRYGWNYREAARAGLLHDLFLYDWHTHARETGQRFHGLTHPRTAMCNAERYFDITEREKNIILRHMWPLTLIPPGCREGFVVVLTDKLCSLTEVGYCAGQRIGIKRGPALARR